MKAFVFFPVLLLASLASRLLEANPQSDYTFNPINVKRDPFYPPTLKGPEKVNDILKYDLNEMNLVAILTGMGAPQAMIVLPNNKTHILQVGDSVGKHNGKIFKITSTEVIVRENFTDFQNKKKTNLTSLVLAQ